MEKEEIIKICQYYKGEETLPKKWEDNYMYSSLWQSEKTICEQMPDVIGKENPIDDLARYVYSLLGKWTPYEANEYMDEYIKIYPHLHK